MIHCMIIQKTDNFTLPTSDINAVNRKFEIIFTPEIMQHACGMERYAKIVDTQTNA